MRTLFWIALLVGWLCLAVGLLVISGERILFALAVTLLGLVTTVGLIHRRWAAAIAALSVILFSGLWLWVERDTGNPAAVLAMVTGCGGALWLSWGVQSRITELYQLVWGLRRRIEELSVEDSTGALKLEAGKTLMAVEVERCRRYRRPLSVMRVGPTAPADWLRVHGTSQLNLLDRSVAQLLREMLRTEDRIIHVGPAEYLVFLPETPLTGARIVAHRLAYAAKERLESEIRLGIAEFPTNGQSTDQLIDEADAALLFARGADLSVASLE